MFIGTSNPSKYPNNTSDTEVESSKSKSQAPNRTHQSEDKIPEHKFDQTTEESRKEDKSPGLRHKFRLGNFHCNRYQNHPTLFASCNIENICVTTAGSFVLFHPSDRLSHRKQEYLELLTKHPWVYNQGRYETDRGKFFTNIIDGDLMFEFSENKIRRVSSIKIPLDSTNQSETLQETFEKGSLQQLHTNFTYYEKPVYGLKRYAAGNMGHFIFENIMLAFSNLVNHKPTETYDDIERAMDNHILYLDDLYDNTKDNWISIYEYDKEVATQFSLEISKLMSKNTVLQLCNNNEYFTVEKLPCQSIKPTNTPKGDSNVLQACFSSLILGLTKDIFFDRDGRENLFVTYRQFAYHSLSISPLPSDEDSSKMIQYLSKKPIKIAIHKKSLNSHFGRTIANTMELKQAIEESLKNSPYIQKFHKTQQIICDVFEFKTMTPLEQVKFFADVDFYITDQGSSAYYSVYLRKDTTVVIAPECTGRKGCYTPLGVEKLIQLSNARVLNYMELLSPGEVVECNKRPTKGFGDNCDSVLSTSFISDLVLRGLKSRYRTIVESKLNKSL